MRNLYYFLIFAFASSLVSSCIIIDDDDGGPCVNGNRDYVVRDYSLSRIEGIDVAIDAQIYLLQGNQQRVEIEGPPNVLDLITFDMSNRTWFIDTYDCYRNADLRFYITLRELDVIRNYGSANIITSNEFFVNDLEIQNHGSGKIDLEVDADDILVDVRGSGDVVLYGVCDDLDVLIDGSGDFGTFSMRCEDAIVNIQGSGDAEITVLDELDVAINGSGNVLFRGFPSVQATINGSGQVIDAN